MRITLSIPVTELKEETFVITAMAELPSWTLGAKSCALCAHFFEKESVTAVHLDPERLIYVHGSCLTRRVTL
jgi:hypothetical protein